MDRKPDPPEQSRRQNPSPLSRNQSVARLLAEAASQRQSGNIEKAQSFCLEALRADPRCAEAHFHLGHIHITRDDLALASKSFQTAIDIHPAYPEAHLTLALLFRADGDNGAAENHFREAVRHRPDYAEAHFLLGQGLMDQSRSGEAAASLKEALRLKPDYYQARFLLGNALRALGDISGAIESYKNVLQQNPDAPEVHLYLGAALQERGDHAEALRSYQAALRLRPGFAEAYFGMGVTHYDQREFSLAKENYTKAIEHDPEYMEARHHLAALYGEMGLFEEAYAAHQELHRLRPDDPLLKLTADIYCPGIFDSSKEIRARREEIEAALDSYEPGSLQIDAKRLDYHPSPPFYMAFHNSNERPWRSKYAALFHRPAAKASPETLARHAESGAAPRLKIGFVTTYKSEDPFLLWMKGMALNLDAEKFNVSILCHKRSHAKIAGGIGAREDISYVFIKENLDAAAEDIRDLGLDAIIYHEIGTDSFNYLLPIHRLAPLQCVTLGCGYTTGIPEMDYFISTNTVEPGDCEAHYSERLIRFDTAPAYLYRPETAFPLKERPHFGFTEADHIYACPQTLFKIHPDFIEPIGEILRGDLRGQLIMVEGFAPAWNERLMRRFQEKIPDVADRIRLLPRMPRNDLFSLLSISDVILDPLLVGGGTTALESVTIGTPTVTMPGKFARGRVLFAFYQLMGVMDCVASSPEEYVQLALRLGGDRAYNEEVKAKILAANHLIFEDMDYVRELENFLLEAVKKARAGIN